MPASLTLRPFEPSDAEAVSQLIVDNLWHVNVRDYGEAVVTELARFYAPEGVRHYAQAGEMIVARIGPTLVGTATLQQARVRNVFVSPLCHGQGIGRRLMAHLEDAARRQGLTTLALRAGLGAVAFYQKLGYTPMGLREAPLGEAVLKSMEMEKTL